MRETGIKGVQVWTWLGWKCDSQEILKVNKIWPNDIYTNQRRINFPITLRYKKITKNPARKPDLELFKKKKKKEIIIKCFFFFFYSRELQTTNERVKKIDNLSDIENKKIVEYNSDGSANCSKGIFNDPLKQEKLKIRGRIEPVRLQHWWDRLEHSEDSWGSKESCCQSDSSERLHSNVSYRSELAGSE